MRRVPTGIVVLRATHFVKDYGRIKHGRDEHDALVRTVGRNVTFRDLMAEAYDIDSGRVVLPADAPGNGFDFLVTVSPKPRKQLRAAIEKELGFVAATETRETEVVVLRVKDSRLPGLTVSAAGEDDTVFYRDGKLHFQNQPLSAMFKGVEDGLGRPLVDETGLTNNYDYSVVFSGKTEQAMRAGAFSLEGVQKVFADLGLELKPETMSQEMLMVRKAP